MASAGKITINLEAGTAQFILDMDKANRKLNELGSQGENVGKKLREAGAHGITAVQGVSAGLRTLEGGVTNNLRAAERFLAVTLNLGKAFQVAFPVFGAIAMVGVLERLIGKAGEVYDAFVKMQEAPKRILDGFRNLSAPLEVANAELQVANDKLENEIAKLQGKPQNNLKLALDEAIASSTNLSKSLQKNLEDVSKLFETNKTGAMDWFFGKASDSGVRDRVKRFRDDLSSIDTAGQLNIHVVGSDTAAGMAAQNQLDKTRKTFLDEELKRAQRDLTEAQKAQGEKYIRSPLTGNISGVNPAFRDQSHVIADLQTYIGILADESNRISLTQQNLKDQGTVNRLKENANNRKLARSPYDDAIAQLQAQHTALEAKLNTSGLNSGSKAIAEGFGAAVEKITELNRQLKEADKQPLTFAQKMKITDLEEANALLKAQASINDKMKADQDELNQKLAEQAKRHQDNVDKLTQELNASKALADAALEGPQALRAAQEKLKLAGIQDPDERSLTAGIDANKEQAALNTQIRQIETKTEAIEAMSDAYRKGVEAQRAATLASIQNSGQDQKVIDAQIAQQNAVWHQEDIQSGSARGGGSMADGARQYFQSMKDNAKSAAQETKDVLGNAFAGLSQQMTSMITQGKANWVGFFESLGAEIGQLAMNRAFLMLFGGLLGGGSGTGTLSSGLPDLLGVQLGGNGAAQLGSALGGGGGIGGFFADGGDINAGKAYMVGERGPELFAPRSSGTVIPNHKLGGNNAYYTIDARGANAADVEMRVRRSLEAVHGQSVRDAGAAMMDSRARQPRGRF